MKRFIITIIAAATFFVGEAQTLRTYYVVFPKNADPNVKNIYVSDFEKSDILAQTILPHFGENIANGIKAQIRSSERYGNVEYIPQSWRRTDIYEVGDDKSSAQWVLTGTFDIKSDKKRDVSTEIKKDNSAGAKYNIPFECIYYDYSNSVNVKVSMELKDKQGNVIASYEKEQAKESHPKRDMRKPDKKLSSPEELANSTQQFFVMDISNQFLPWLKGFNYVMKEIKNRDIKDHVSKDRYKEFKKELRNDKDMVKKLDYYGLGQLYMSLAEDTGIDAAYTNLAYVYEVLGNYTKAREIYQDLGDSNGLERVKFFENERDELKSFGKDYFEPEI